MPKRRTTRIYQKRGRFYGDFRDLGGSQEALVPEGEDFATTDPDVAAHLASERVKELEKRRRNRTLLGVERDARLHSFASEHLVAKKKAGRVTDGWLAESEKRLREAVGFFGKGRSLHSIGVKDVEAYAAYLQALDNGRGGTLAPGTQRHYLNALSNLFRRAQGEGAVPAGYNPVAALMEKPSPARREASWLEVPDAALLLEAARVYRPKPPHQVHPDLHAIVAAFLLTGGRKREVLGLMVEDVSFDRGTVTFRPNDHRALKTATSHRVVPMHPQLREILQKHVFGQARVSGLLFPSPSGGMIHDLRKALDGIGELAGFEAGEIRTKMFRHTFCAASLQLLDRGAPVSPWTVAKWMGHGGQTLVNRVYGHLGDVRHRSEVLEYRADQHREALGERLAAVQAWKPARCRAETPGGERCKVRDNLAPSGLCLWHDPKRKEEARRARPHARK